VRKVFGKLADRCSDAELLAATVDVADAFGVFYSRHSAPVLKYLASRAPDTATALDVMSEVFAAAYIGRDRFEPEQGPARSWLFGIAAHKLADARRSGRREMAARRKLGIARHGYTDAALEEAEAMIDATRLVDGLPPLERDAVLARVVHDRDYGAIAADAKVTPVAIRRRVSNGLAKLAQKARP
jgi:RNA polymerase sigma-70 factor (ECF subfamily)